MTKKLFRKESAILTFCFKLFSYIHNNYRGEYIEKIKNYSKNKDKIFQKFLNYFLKNWLDNKSYNFNRISNENYKRRTNNICESFHRTINKQINHSHPKITYLTIFN